MENSDNREFEGKIDEAITHLKRMRNKVVNENPKSEVRPPEFMAVITGNSPYPRQIEEGIYVIPIRAFTA